MEWNSTETIIIEREAGCCQDGSDLRKLLEEYDSAYFRWQDYIDRLISESGLSYNQLAARSGVSKNTLRDWCQRGTKPKSRDTLIKLGFGLDMSLEELNRLLFYGGRFHRLYPRDLQDAACIFVLRQRMQHGGDRKYNYCLAQHLCQEALQMAGNKELEGGQSDSGKETGVSRVSCTPHPGDSLNETQAAMDRLLLLETQQEFFEFVAQAGLALTVSRSKLTSYIQDFIQMRLREWESLEGTPISWHGLALRWGSEGELEKMLSCLKHHGMVPRRDRLIALGLRLSMTMPELNTMLNYAGMEGLYARDKLECVLIYALQNIELLHPEVQLGNALQLLHVTKDREIKQQCSHIVEEYMERCYRGEDGDWTQLAEYICGVLEELDLPEAEELLLLLR